MRGDVVLRAVEQGGGAFDADQILSWLAAIVRTLRTQPSVACGGVGTFETTQEQGTVEIVRTSRAPAGPRSARALSFVASPTLLAIVEQNALTDELLAGLEDEDPLAAAFGRALATELVLSRKATIGNFGTWSVGQKPNLQRFVRFRSQPAINRML